MSTIKLNRPLLQQMKLRTAEVHNCSVAERTRALRIKRCAPPAGWVFQPSPAKYVPVYSL